MAEMKVFHSSVLGRELIRVNASSLESMAYFIPASRDSMVLISAMWSPIGEMPSQSRAFSGKVGKCLPGGHLHGVLPARHKGLWRWCDFGF